MNWRGVERELGHYKECDWAVEGGLVVTGYTWQFLFLMLE